MDKSIFPGAEVVKAFAQRLLLTGVVLYFGYQVFHLTQADLVVFFFLGISFLFNWRGETSVIVGVLLFVLTLLLKRTRPELLTDIQPLLRYQWWFLIGGIVLIIFQRIHLLYRAFYSAFVTQQAYTKKASIITLKASIITFYFFLKQGKVFLSFLRYTFFTVLPNFWQFVPIFFRWLQRTAPVWYHRFFPPLSRLVITKFVATGILVILLFFFTNLLIIDIFFILFFAIGVLMQWDSRIALNLSLICFLLLPLLFVFDQKLWAETIAVYAYYFLVIGVLEQVVEFWREQRAERIHEEGNTSL